MVLGIGGSLSIHHSGSPNPVDSPCSLCLQQWLATYYPHSVCVCVWYSYCAKLHCDTTLCVCVCCCTEFVEGGFYEDSGKWRQDNSLCETTAPNSVKNGLVVACFVLSFVVIIGWVACIFLMKRGLRPPPPNKP